MVTAVAANAPAGETMDILPLIMNASGVVMGVLFLLISLSVVSWFIIGYKALYYARASSQSTRFLDAFWAAKRLDTVYQESEALADSPLAQMFKAGYVELTKITQQKTQSPDGSFGEGSIENVERALRRAYTTEMTHLEGLIPFLATTGSAGPFVGLFGTVWGIMNSFRSIGLKGAANLSTVAPGIAEALIATAIGLVAAIPAVMAFNYFTRKVKVLSSEMESFSNDFLNIVKRHFLR
ncbi:MAG: protein TolQ [Myxococcales bacterium]|nr:protein TolQ [Myxococcales bacterium]